MINLLHNVWGKSFTFSLNWCFLGKIMNLRKIDDHLASPPSPPTPPLSLRKNKSSSLSISSPHKNFNNYSAPTFNYRSIHIFNNIPPFHHIHIEYLLNIFFIVKVSFFALQIAHWSMTAQWHVIHRNAEKQIYLETVALRKTYETYRNNTKYAT